MKTRCYFLGYRGFGKKISGKLLDAKPVEGHVCVHGLNDPVPKRPTVPELIGLKTVGIGIAGQIQPLPGPMLSITGRGKKALNDLFTGVRGIIIEKGIDFPNRRWQSDKPEAYSAQPTGFVRRFARGPAAS